jgi:hypothetical protein
MRRAVSGSVWLVLWVLLMAGCGGDGGNGAPTEPSRPTPQSGPSGPRRLDVETGDVVPRGIDQQIEPAERDSGLPSVHIHHAQHLKAPPTPEGQRYEVETSSRSCEPTPVFRVWPRKNGDQGRCSAIDGQDGAVSRPR